MVQCQRPSRAGPSADGAVPAAQWSRPECRQLSADNSVQTTQCTTAGRRVDRTSPVDSTWSSEQGSVFRLNKHTSMNTVQREQSSEHSKAKLQA